MIRLEHLLHPMRAIEGARDKHRKQRARQLFALHSVGHFRGDRRFDLQNVSEGFKPHPDSADDTTMIGRICTAYLKAVTDERSAPACYQPTEWWKHQRRTCLGPVIDALRNRDIPGLQAMYRNFYRDRCSTGLVGAPFGMSDVYFRDRIKDVYRQSYLGNALYLLDYWADQTHGKFRLADLEGTGVGNPFGVVIDGTLVRAGSEYHHYCAQRMKDLLGAGKPAIAEIGGGYGGAAYYLLRDRPAIAYVNFDVPESIALASYYLLRSLPHARFLLYGEGELTVESLSRADVALLPLFCLPRMPEGSVEATFSSHSMSDVASEAMMEYLNTIARISRSQFLHIGHLRSARLVSERLRNRATLIEDRPSLWHSHRAPDVIEMESLYQWNRD